MTTFEWIVLTALVVALWLLMMIVGRLNQVVEKMLTNEQSANRLEFDVGTIVKHARDITECQGQLSLIESRIGEMATNLNDMSSEIRAAGQNKIVPGLRDQIGSLREAVEGATAELKVSVSATLSEIEINTRR